jgi:hypothetical protein
VPAQAGSDGCSMLWCSRDRARSVPEASPVFGRALAMAAIARAIAWSRSRLAC